MKLIKSIILSIILVSLFASCGASRGYTYYNVTVVDDGNGGRAYYPHVYVRSYEAKDSLATVSFMDTNGHLYILCGRRILVETVVNRNTDVYFYDYHRPVTRYYHYSRPPRYHYHYRTTPRPHNPPRHGGHSGHNNHRRGGRR